jgi:hypothetical protein
MEVKSSLFNRPTLSFCTTSSKPATSALATGVQFPNAFSDPKMHESCAQNGRREKKGGALNFDFFCFFLPYGPVGLASLFEMAHNPKAAPLGTDPKEMYRNLGMEISSLPDTAKYDKVCAFLRRNANVYVDMNELAEQIKYVSRRTLTRWMSEIRKSA